MVTFQSQDSYVEFVVDTVKDVSFSFLPTASPHQSASSAELSAAGPQLILLAISDDNNRSLSVYVAADNDDSNDDTAGHQLIVERRLQTIVDRLNISLYGACYV